MIVKIEGVRWYVADPAGILAEHESKPPIARQRFILGCEACEQICTIEYSCDCCLKFGKAFGGKRVRTTSPHKRFPKEPVIEYLRRRAA